MSDLAKKRIPRIRWRPRFPALGQEHAAALGQIAASWSDVEAYCGFLIQVLIEREGEPGHAITANMSFLDRINTLSTLLNCTRDPDLLEHWSDMCRIMDDLRTRRNDFIHAEWQVFSYLHTARRTKARGRVSIHHRHVDVRELTKLEEEIVSMIEQISWLGGELGKKGFSKALDAWKTKPPLDRSEFPKALSLAQARASKKARQQADRERDLAARAEKKKP